MNEDFNYSEEPLRIRGMNIIERCLGNCNYCGADMKANGPQMTLELFDGVLESPNIIIGDSKKHIYLGYGELLLYPNLLHALKKLLSRGLVVALDTAGLLPTNQEIGERVLRALPNELSAEELSALRIGVSFNLLTNFSPKEYLRGMKLTFDLLFDCMEPGQVHAILMNNGSNQDETFSALMLLGFDIQSGRFPKIKERKTGPYARALENYSQEQMNTNSEEKTCIALNSKVELFGISANGGIIPNCRGFGQEGAFIGNVQKNSPSQIRALYYGKFLKEHRERCSKIPDGILRCEHHRRWQKFFTAPRSINPVVRQAMRIKKTV